MWGGGGDGEREARTSAVAPSIGVLVVLGLYSPDIKHAENAECLLI